MTILAFFQKNAQKCSQKWAYLKNGLSYSLVAWRGCYYQQSPAIATFTYAKGWKKKFKHVKIFKSTVLHVLYCTTSTSTTTKVLYYLSLVRYEYSTVLRF